ncbi:MAG: PH domain-containing protein [Pirellulaceae bacterium]
MKQPIAGVAPAELVEANVMTVWPSIAAYPSGQLLGRLFSLHWPDIYIFRVGNLLALLAIPYAVLLYFRRIAPTVGMRYTISNRRVVVQRGLRSAEERSIALNAFDEVQVDVRPGQAWYPAGDLVLRQSGKEVFRLSGVSHPEGLRQVILKTRGARLGVQQAWQQHAGCA